MNLQPELSLLSSVGTDTTHWDRIVLSAMAKVKSTMAHYTFHLASAIAGEWHQYTITAQLMLSGKRMFRQEIDK